MTINDVQTASQKEFYGELLQRLKQRINGVRQHIVLSANQQQILLYYEIGREIIEQQEQQGWGAKVIDRLSTDLRTAFPDMRGLSSSNLKYMKMFAQAYPFLQISQQSADQIENVLIGQSDVRIAAPVILLPWFHIVVLITKITSEAERDWYAGESLANGWSRATLEANIKSGLYHRQGKAITNFANRLPEPQSELAANILKDPYHFDFLGLGNEAHEKDIENALTKNITKFLLELGTGFAFIGRQYRLEVNGDEFFVDLLFYHIRLRCYVAVELKATEFKPEHAGQLNFYLSVIDAQLKNENDKPTIGLLLCRVKNRLVAEYALSGIEKPMGIAEYQLVKALPEPLDICLPTIDEIESSLNSLRETLKNAEQKQ